MFYLGIWDGYYIKILYILLFIKDGLKFFFICEGCSGVFVLVLKLFGYIVCLES